MSQNQPNPTVNTAPTMAGIIGRMDSFDSAAEDWTTYIERLDQYFVANDIPNSKKVAVLLSVMGAKTYNLLRSLMTPDKPADKSYTAIVTALETHLNPKPLVIAERFKFHKRNQLKTESIAEFVAELRRLSEHCSFGRNLLDSLRDRFVCGLINENIQKRLLTEKDLTLKRAIELATSMEAAAKGATELQQQMAQECHVHECNVHKIDKRQQKSDACYRCGKKSHTPAECWFKDKECNKCQKTGHIQKMCKTKMREKVKEKKFHKRKDKQREMHDIETCSSDTDSAQDLACFDVCSLKRPNRGIIWVSPKVEGKTLTMELDTGSALSVISKKDYQAHFSHLKLQSTDVMLKTYTGERIAPMGVVKVKVHYSDQRHVLSLYVVERGGAPLFGREWLREIQLDWQSIKEMQATVTKKQSTGSTTEKLNKILTNAGEVFQDGIGTLKHLKAQIVLEDDAVPKFHKARQVPYALRPKVENELQRLENEGILSKVDWSEWATPIVPVVKGNGSVRLCGDFKVTVNPVLKAEQYPLPRIDDIFAALGQGKRFSKIDLAQAYLQMEMEESSKKYLTINTSKGLYQYNRLVFGIASAPAIWQKAMEQVLQGIPNTQCYLDDIVITGENDDAHLENLEKVLKRLNEFGLRANKAKCEFFQDEIEYCGHKIDKNGLHKCKDKIDAVLKAPPPQNVSQLRSFLGLVNYYRKFLPNLSSVLHPLNCLLQLGNKWHWSQDCEKAFKQAKELVTSDNVLTHYDPQVPLKLACDASPYGIGAVLSHRFSDGTERPIAFASRSLNTAERNYAQIDREALSLVWGVKKFNQYLYGKHFTLLTDHKPLVSIFNPAKGVPAMAAARLQRWALFLSAHTYSIEYKGTQHHGNADGLSRLPLQVAPPVKTKEAVDMFQMAQVDPLPVTSEEIARETGRDPVLSKVYELTLKGWPRHGDSSLPGYSSRREQLTVHQGCILWGARVVIPPKLRQRVLSVIHEGHLGVVKMKGLARSFVWWPGIDEKLEELAKTCYGCQQTQKSPPTAPLHVWEWPTKPWQRVHIDYAGPFLDHMYLVVVDAHSKWPEVFCTKTATSAKTVELLRALFARTGLPHQIVSDNGTPFTAEEFQRFVRKNGIQHTTIVPYHPASNGQAERFIQTFKHSIKAMDKDTASLRQKIANFLLAYRNSTHAVTGQTPAMLFLGRPLRSRLDLLKPSLQQHVQKKQSESALRSQTRSLRTFQVGQQVIAKDYRNKGQKWQTGTIVSQTGPLTYQVKVGQDLVWRRHVDQLLDASGSTSVDANDTPFHGDFEFSDEAQDTGGPEDDAGGSAPASPVPQRPAVNPVPQSPTANTSPVRRYPERIRRPPERFQD